MTIWCFDRAMLAFRVVSKVWSESASSFFRRSTSAGGTPLVASSPSLLHTNKVLAPSSTTIL